MRVDARVADAGDVASVIRLATLASEEKLGQRGGELWDAFDKYDYATAPAVELAIADSNALVAVGEIDQATIGFCAARLRQPITAGQTSTQLEVIFVEPGAREVGVGEAMMSLVIDWATDMGCRGIDSVAMPGDRATKNFFESFGLVARSITVHLSL